MVKKVSIIGAGAVGSTLAYNLLNRLKLQELVLIDIYPGLACGIALDLEDTRGILNFSTNIIGSENYSDIKGSDIVVLTAGVARKQGMSRADLFKTNSKVAVEASRQIKKLAASAIVITVTNPLDVITCIVNRQTKFDRKRVIGMGALLDTSRLLNIIYKSCRILPSSVDAFVYGLHNKDMIVSTAKMSIKGQKLDKFMSKQSISQVPQKVQLRGAEIVKNLKTRSASFAPALSCSVLIEAIAFDKSEIMPVSVLLSGEYGLKGVCMGVPCVINAKGADSIIEMPLSAGEKKAIIKVNKFFQECMI
ncbi:MAG: malate dehydrogenase [Candidatus Omnitrophica bacterium]|nr:malate dehydrogenase [Candidatus Omnitrophota bacterium]MDD5429128.1 malate dehydrogenase [Candidatus Omnitrophota bacterium]